MNIVWTIDAMDCYTQLQGNSDVVYNAHWRCTGSDGNTSTSIYGTCSTPYAGGSFTPYQDLTQQEVLDWVWENGVDQQTVEARVTSQVNAILNPTTVTPPLPWSA